MERILRGERGTTQIGESFFDSSQFPLIDIPLLTSDFCFHSIKIFPSFYHRNDHIREVDLPFLGFVIHLRKLVGTIIQPGNLILGFFTLWTFLILKSPGPTDDRPRWRSIFPAFKGPCFESLAIGGNGGRGMGGMDREISNQDREEIRHDDCA